MKEKSLQKGLKWNGILIFENAKMHKNKKQKIKCQQKKNAKKRRKTPLAEDFGREAYKSPAASYGCLAWFLRTCWGQKYQVPQKNKWVKGKIDPTATCGLVGFFNF